MDYSVGDIVLIDPQLEEGYGYSVYVNNDMVEHAGKQARITRRCSSEVERFNIDIDNGSWVWSSDIFKEIVDPRDTIQEADRDKFMSDLNKLLG